MNIKYHIKPYPAKNVLLNLYKSRYKFYILRFSICTYALICVNITITTIIYGTNIVKAQ